MNQKNREQLLQWINMVHFMMIDLNEYLDTHPYDENAMDSYNHYLALYKKAVKEYAAYYGPLNLSVAMPDKKWCWALSKNPWERGYA